MGLTGQELASFTTSKVGTPYVYGAKGADGIFTQSKLNALKKGYPTMFTKTYMDKIATMHLVGRVCTDCSGLFTWYTGKTMGSAQMYKNAYARLPMNKLDDFAIGTVLWKSGHVGVYCGKDANGKPICVEARGIDYGTVIGVITNPNRLTCGLTFKDIDYAITNKIENVTYKKKNPYTEPTTTLKRKNKVQGESVKWLQWELVEAGYGHKFSYKGKNYTAVSVDGIFGPVTEAALLAYQSSTKTLSADGECGPLSINSLKEN